MRATTLSAGGLAPCPVRGRSLANGRVRRRARNSVTNGRPAAAVPTVGASRCACALAWRSRVRRCRPWWWRAEDRRTSPPIVRRPRRSEQLAGPAGGGHRLEVVEVLLDHGLCFRSSPRSRRAAPARVSSHEAPAPPGLRAGGSDSAACCAGAGAPPRSARTNDDPLIFGVAYAGAGTACLVPLGDVRGVQAFSAQERPTMGEPAGSAPYSSRIADLYSAVKLAAEGRDSRVGPVHHAIMDTREQRCSRHGHRSRCSGLAL